ncbi:hypothetical protein KCU98_g9223, partial [Aureobasidium melanogenum]
MDVFNELSPLQSLGSRIESAFKKFQWGLTKNERSIVVFDKVTCCKAPTNAVHNTWWAYVAPAYHPCVTGFGKTLQKALESLYDQPKLGPEIYTTTYDAQIMRSIVSNGTNLDTTMPGVKIPTLTKSLTSGPGSQTQLPAAPAPLQMHGLASVPQPLTSGGAKHTVQLPQKVTNQNNGQKGKKKTSNSSSTPSTHHTIQMPNSGLNGGNSASNASLDQLMEEFKSLQKRLDAMSNTLRTTDFQSHLKSPIPPLTGPTSTPSASFGKPPAPQLNETQSKYKQSSPMFGSEKKELKHQAIQEHETNLPKVYQSPRIGSTGHHSLPSPVFSSRSNRHFISNPSAPSSTNVQTMTPTYASMAAISVPANALAPSQRTKETDPSLFQLPSEISDTSASAIAGISINIVQSEHAKRKHEGIDDGVIGSLRMSVEQRSLKNPKTEEWFQTIKNEENSPKKIKIEDHSQELDSH